MSFPTFNDLSAFTPDQRLQLEQYVSYVIGYLSQQHKDTGAHGTVTADSLAVVGAITGASGTFTGDVVTNNGSGAECGLGTLTTVNGAALEAAELSRKGLLLGGVTNGMWLEQRAFASPFTSGYELRLWNFAWDAATALMRIGIVSSVPTLMDGGTGSTAMNLGAATRPLANVYANNFLQEASSWTPVLGFGGASVGITYSVQAGNYTVFGDVVIANFKITLTSKGSSVGNATITGLPYASLNGRENGVLDTPNAAMLGLTSTPFIVISSSTLFPSQTNATGRTQLTDANFTNTSDFRASIVYKK